MSISREQTILLWPLRRDSCIYRARPNEKELVRERRERTSKIRQAVEGSQEGSLAQHTLFRWLAISCTVRSPSRRRISRVVAEASCRPRESALISYVRPRRFVRLSLLDTLEKDADRSAVSCTAADPRKVWPETCSKNGWVCRVFAQGRPMTGLKRQMQLTRSSRIKGLEQTRQGSM